MIRLAFFDVDGTLSVPIYNDNGRFVIGFTLDRWKEHCTANGEDAYVHCRPVMPVKRYAEKLAADGVKLFVLTTSLTDAETSAKEKFIRQNFPGMFEEIFAVSANKEKLEKIREIAQAQGVPLSECELVEDTLATLLAVQEHGIKATHVAGLVCDL